MGKKLKFYLLSLSKIFLPFPFLKAICKIQLGRCTDKNFKTGCGVNIRFTSSSLLICRISKSESARL